MYSFCHLDDDDDTDEDGHVDADQTDNNTSVTVVDPASPTPTTQGTSGEKSKQNPGGAKSATATPTVQQGSSSKISKAGLKKGKLHLNNFIVRSSLLRSIILCLHRIKMMIST